MKNHILYCDLRGADINFSLCFGCGEPEKHGTDAYNCPFSGTAIEDQV